MITAPHSVSLDGFIADADHRSDRLRAWLRSGDTPSRLDPSFTMSAISARFFDQGLTRSGAVIAGRRTHDVTGAWGGKGPIAGLPLFIRTHRPLVPAPAAEPPYTYVTDGIERAVEQARRAAAGKDVFVMGATAVQQCPARWPARRTHHQPRARLLVRGQQHGRAVLPAIFGLVATLTLLIAIIAGLGVLNTVVLQTRERVHGLGVFKAIGMTPRQTTAMVASTLTLSGLAIAVAGPLGPASWAARTRTAAALRTE